MQVVDKIWQHLLINVYNEPLLKTKMDGIIDDFLWCTKVFFLPFLFVMWHPYVYIYSEKLVPFAFLYEV